ncbi:MAG: serine hydrolase [Anaerolineae bacterium]|nr:class A beta-lactamase-related serine hydrolase [Thermoflexales bacterium]MDW8408717.1 serine hydrolase [Anaerolineae bacterium]
MRRRPSPKSTFKLGSMVAAAVLALVLIGNLISFAATRDRLPRETYLADVDVSGMTVPEAIERVQRALQAPLTLRYQTQVLTLVPAQIEFKLNDAVARLVLERIVRRNQGMDQFLPFVLRQVSPSRLPPPYQYSDEKLQAYLLDIAAQYDRPPTLPSAEPGTLNLRPGADGLALNLTEARDRVLAALSSGINRTLDLPVDVVPLTDVGTQVLGDLISVRISGFVAGGNVAGVFVKDVRSGREFSLNGEVAFSAAGWLKLPLLIEAYRAADPLSPALIDRLTSMIVEGSSLNANEVLRELGAGDADQGVVAVNVLLKKLGLVNTFLAQPFGQQTLPPTFVTPANARADVNTNPDPRAQSTPADVALLLEMIEQCRLDAGPLVLLFPQQLTPDKCNQMLELLARNRLNGLLEAGSGSSTVISRQSWDANNHGVVGLVRSPGGDYIVAVMLHGSAPLNWADTSLIIADVARAAYSFFNNGQAPPPAQPIAAPPPP